MKTGTVATASILALGLVCRLTAYGQQPGQPNLTIESANRTLSVTASDTVNMEPDIALLHIGFETAPTDAKAAYAAGSRTSNEIIEALKRAGVAESDIRSESQYLAPDYSDPKQHKYKLTQQWTVRCTPARAAEILNVAVDAGATSSGEVEWNVKDEKALESQALDKAVVHARDDAATLAKGMGVQLGRLLYVSNQASSSILPRPIARAFAMKADSTSPLAVEPQKVSREATVYAVFAIE